MPPPKSKKLKPSGSAGSASTSKVAQIKSLEQALLPSAADRSPSLNPLVDLLRLTTTAAEPEVVHKGVYACGRVFAYLAVEGRVGPSAVDARARKAAEVTEGEEKVRRWLADRLDEWVTFCQGLLKDVEGDLRAAGLANLLGLLPALSPVPTASTSDASSSSNPQPQYPTNHLRALLQPFLFPSPSMRGGSEEFSLVDEDDDDDEDEIKGMQVEADMVEKLGQTMEKNRDIKWAVYREVSYLLRPFMTDPESSHPYLATNVFTLLATQTTFPATQKALEKLPVLLPGFADRPFITAAGKAAKGETDPDDWRAYFDSDSEESDDGAPKARGPSAPGKGKRKEVKGKKGEKKRELGGRVKQMTVHEGIWSLESLRAGFTSAWMALLSLPLESSIARQILVILHHQVLPNMTKGRAVRTADWLGEWVDRGGPLGLLALNSLFILITQYNLDYPDFYTKLYSMVDRAVLHVKYRARFFRLTEAFLSSSHLPATLIASFAKRLARLALFAPPAGVVIVIPFIYNLLKMHPSCMVLIHRDTYGGEELSLSSPVGAADPYEPSNLSPFESKALDSSLWEIAALQRHYLSPISSLAKIFSEVFTKPKYGMEDFLDHTYMTMFDTETKRHLKNDPALALPVEGAAFPAKRARDDDGEETVYIGRDAVAELWTF